MNGIPPALLFMISILLLPQLAVCDWTFSLRISSAQCCDSPACEQVGTCDDLFIGLCLRDPGHTVLDRVSCPIFIAGTGANITDRELTPADIVDANLKPLGLTSISSAYKGSIQVYIGVLTQPDLQRYGPDEIIVDELFVELESRAGGEGSSAANEKGERKRITLSVSLMVECSPGYTEDLNCTGPTPSPSTVSPTSDSLSTVSPTSDSPTSNTLVIAVAAGGGGFVLLLVIIIVAVVAVILVCRRRRREDKPITPCNINDPEDPSPQLQPAPELHPTIPPNEDDLVTYTTVMHNKKVGYRNIMHGDHLGEAEEKEAGSGGLTYVDIDHNGPIRSPDKPQGLIYTDVDHDRATYTTFKMNPNRKPVRPPSHITGAPVQYSTIKPPPSHKYMNVPQPAPRQNKNQGQQNMYSTLRGTV